MVTDFGSLNNKPTNGFIEVVRSKPVTIIMS